MAAFLAAATESHAAVSAAREYPLCIWAEAQLFCGFCSEMLRATDVMGWEMAQAVLALAEQKHNPSSADEGGPVSVRGVGVGAAATLATRL